MGSFPKLRALTWETRKLSPALYLRAHRIDGSRNVPQARRPGSSTGLSAIPDRSPLGRRMVDPPLLLHDPRSISEEKLARCVQWRRPHPRRTMRPSAWATDVYQTGYARVS